MDSHTDPTTQSKSVRRKSSAASLSTSQLLHGGNTQDTAHLSNFGTKTLGFSRKPSLPQGTSAILDFVINDRSIEETRAIYNLWAASYEEDMTAQEYKAPELLANYVTNIVDSTSTNFVLDLGCGTGLFGQALNKRGKFTISGIDISEEMIREAEKKQCYQSFQLDKIGADSELDLPVGKYQCIVMCGSFLPGHISPKALPKITELLNFGQYVAWIGPSLEMLSQKDGAFTEKIFLKNLDKMKDMQLVTRQAVLSYRKAISGELFCLKKKK